VSLTLQPFPHFLNYIQQEEMLIIGCDNCEQEEKYDMRFVGLVGGRLIKSAPSGIPEGAIRNNPLHMADLSYWELVNPLPKFTIPTADEDGGVYIVEEEPEVPFIYVDKEYQRAQELKSLAKADNKDSSIELDNELSKMTVNELRAALKEKGVKVKDYWKKADLVARLEMASEET